MALNIPMPGAPTATGDVSDVYNQLLNTAMAQRKNALANQYYPLTTTTNALSKLAYANLMGPQFMAKLMGNPALLPSIPNPQDKLSYLVNAAQSGGGNLPNTGQAVGGGGNINSLFQGNSEVGGLTGVVQKLANKLLGQPTQQQAQQYQQPTQPFQNNEAQQGMSRPSPNGLLAPIGNAPLQTPTMPTSSDQSIQPNESQNITMAKRQGRSEGLVAEEKEKGKIRANDIQDLDNSRYAGEAILTSLDESIGLLTSPAIESITQLPFAQQHSFGWYRQKGTKDQQNAIGRLDSIQGQVVSDFVRNLGKTAIASEITLAKSAKFSDKDPINVMKGKVESMKSLAMLAKERARLTSAYENQMHITKGEAFNLADKQINGAKIRQDIHNQLYPKPTEKDREHMKKLHGLNDEQLDAELKSRGIL